MGNKFHSHRGWSYQIGSPGGRPSRNTRGTNQLGTKPYFQRNSDKLKIQAGDFITIDEFDKEEPTVYLVKELKPDLEESLVVIQFYRKSDIYDAPKDADPQELYLEPGDTSAKITDVEDKVRVFTHESYKKLTLGPKDKNNVFFCKRCYDGERFSKEIKINLIAENISVNPKEQMQNLRSLFSGLSPIRSLKRSSSISKQPASKRGKLKEHFLIDSEEKNGPQSTNSDSDINDMQQSYSISTVPGSQSQSQSQSDPVQKLNKNKGEIEVEEVILIDDSDQSSESETETITDIKPPLFITKSLSNSPVSKSPKKNSSSTNKSKATETDTEEADFPSSTSSESESDDDDDSSNEYADASETINDDISSDSSGNSDSELDSDSDYEENLKTKKYSRKLEKLTNNNKKQRGRGRPKTKPDGPKSLIDKNFGMVEEELTLDLTMKNISDILPGRDSQFKELLNTVEGALKGRSSSVIYVSGPPGIGKTLTTRTLVKYLKTQSDLGSLPRFKSVEINGHKLPTRESAYVKLWNVLSPKEKVPDSKASEHIGKYLQAPSSQQVPVIIILDEMDEIANKSYSLIHNFFDWANLPGSKFIVIGLANTMDLPERVLKNKTVSRLGLTRMTFSSYSHEQLVEIIKVRLKQTHQKIKNVEFESRALEYAARKIASVSGDARRTLNVVSRSIEIADEKRLGDEERVIVKIAHIDRAMKEMTNSAMARSISDLSFFGKLVLAGILSLKKKTGILENKISKLVEELELIIQLVQAKASKDAQFVENVPLIDVFYQDCIIQPRWFRFIMKELNESGMISLNDTHIRSSTLFTLLIDQTEILSVFEKDPALKSFTDAMSN